MLRAGSPPANRVSAPVLGWLLPTVVTATAVVAAVSVVSSGARAGVLWCGLACTAAVAAAAAEAARRGRALTALREQCARQEEELNARLARQQAETLELATVALPEAVARLQRGEFPEDVLKAFERREAGAANEFRAAREAVLRTVLDAVDNEEGMRESAQRAFVNIARRVQAIVHRQAQDLRTMEDRHGNDPAVLDDLLLLDHGNALIGRLADSIAVLGGARPGRQWSRAVPLYSVLRGGISRILDYRRVELHPVSEVAVVGPAVEPLIHALAELLDNATRYSPPHTRVHLSATEVQAGIAIEIEDGGLSLSEEGRARAERMLRDAQAGIDLNDLGETPRLGLAVVGRLAQAYGFQVSLRPSAYGGVRAVLIVPQQLITTAPATGRAHGIGAAAGLRPVPGAIPQPASEPRPYGRTTAGALSAGQSFGSNAGILAESGRTDNEIPVVAERAPNGLPQRRRHARPSRPGPEVSRVPEPAQAPVQPGMWLAAFHEGVNGHTPSTGTAGPTSEESAGKGEQ
ncbi:ATP-binding protein [Kitasatospora sp. NPDC085895]|uniref:ATP-binding protein n=1 Tax=Kitasatospora sp. NPDC085895 TaxID=3155057 RepID=UPI00344BE7F6